ncbi:hypothetical protein XENOCAPTIV_028928 [Xenoophorus captivus]|uniref:Uncharacterized protein n=1 Tax=Xenoophorus captivus TaxID=1517983 RepID=A0ABV0QCB1_9TELE
MAPSSPSFRNPFFSCFHAAVNQFYAVLLKYFARDLRHPLFWTTFLDVCYILSVSCQILENSKDHNDYMCCSPCDYCPLFACFLLDAPYIENPPSYGYDLEHSEEHQPRHEPPSFSGSPSSSPRLRSKNRNSRDTQTFTTLCCPESKTGATSSVWATSSKSWYTGFDFPFSGIGSYVNLKLWRSPINLGGTAFASQLGVYRAFVDNYKVAVETADKCCQANAQFAEISEDLLKHTHSSHPDYPLLQDALRISQNFLSSINEEITPRRQSMTVKKGEVSMETC